MQTPIKKAATIDDLLAQPSSSGVIFPTWSPDGQLFVYRQQGGVFLYDVKHQKSKEWFQPAKLEVAAVKVDESKISGWQNRRVSSDSIQWLQNNKELLTEAGGDLFLIRPNGSHEQLTKTDLAEEDPNSLPMGDRFSTVPNPISTSLIFPPIQLAN